MNDAMRSMLRAYGPIRNSTDEVNALREVIQRVTLLGLHRGGFFDKASFYGGTALRLIYNLDRFSEDMDFCLNEPDPNFRVSPFFKFIAAELARYGLDVSLEENRTGPKFRLNQHL